MVRVKTAKRLIRLGTRFCPVRETAWPIAALKGEEKISNSLVRDHNPRELIDCHRKRSGIRIDGVGDDSVRSILHRCRWPFCCSSTVSMQLPVILTVATRSENSKRLFSGFSTSAVRDGSSTCLLAEQLARLIAECRDLRTIEVSVVRAAALDLSLEYVRQ